jgi:hypothetical protein
MLRIVLAAHYFTRMIVPMWRISTLRAVGTREARRQACRMLAGLVMQTTGAPTSK